MFCGQQKQITNQDTGNVYYLKQELQIKKKILQFIIYRDDGILMSPTKARMTDNVIKDDKEVKKMS